MCGIAGIISPSKGRFNSAHIEQMTRSLSHRGPDGNAVWINKAQQTLLGHCRLSIIDLSTAAAQPMHFADRYSIIHNGEIYNYPEIARILKNKGYRFNTHSDTEVILAAYDCFKENCVDQFEGMFAFCIWDEEEKKLFAARDRFGEKPFYYHFDKREKQLCFASEIKALFSIGIKKEVDEQMLLCFLSLGVASHPEDPSRTFYKDINSLKPGHILQWSVLKEEAPVITQYWKLDGKTKDVTSEHEAINQFRTLFEKSISKQLRADVSIGTSLSGGLDSSSIVATIRSLSDPSSHYSQQAFTAGFHGFDKDETAAAAMIAKQFDLSHHIVSPSASEFADELVQLILHHEEPVISASVYSQYKIFESAKNYGIKILLDGQGADETLAGYQKYIHWFLQELLSRGQFSEYAYEKKKLEQNFVNFDWNLKNWLAASFPVMANSSLQKRARNRITNNQALTADFAMANISDQTLYKPMVRELNDILFYNSTVSGLNELLRYADKNSMAHGREVRLPFLNHELVQYVFNLPASYKIKNGFTKWILRKAMEPLLPASVAWRADKIGFEPPQKIWMENSKVNHLLNDAKQKLVSLHILNKKELNKKNQPHNAYAADRSDWRYLVAGILLT